MSIARERHLIGILGALGLAACQPAAPRVQTSATTGPTSSTVSTTRPSADSANPKNVLIRVSADRFIPRTDAASIRAFVPDVPPVDSGGECMVRRTGGSGATLVTAYYPRRVGAQTQATLTFDSVGHLVRFSERRGVPKPIAGRGLSPAQLDSALRASNQSIRSTNISLDYAIDQAIVINSGAGKPTDAILSTVRTIERLDKLGPPIARIERARRLCGV